MITIREAVEADKPQIWEIIKSVIAGGDTYIFYPDSGKEKMIAYWYGEEKKIYVALLENKIVGTFYLKPNQPDLGRTSPTQVLVAPEAKGRGVGRTMAEFSLEEAKRLGYQAMQFNFVVKTNEIAVKLWQSLGFEIIGEIPEAFRHEQNGLTNAFVMHREL